jgi:DUF4097 and DUF4098 domain-containing protein YvlB
MQVKTGFSLVFAASLLGPLCLPANANTTGDKDCSANHYHVNDLVSYAEMREQRLPAASMNYINPGQNGSIRVHGWEKSDVLVRACVQAAGESESEARAIASQVAIASGAGKIEPHGPTRDERVYWDLSYEVWVPNSGSTTNGSLAVDLTGNAWNGRGLRAETTNGSVRLSVPENYSAQIEASTVNGGLHVDFPINVSGEVGKTLSFQLGTGGPTIETKTVNGGVHISRRA